ncbi:hypothetical protein RF11_10729 [Thelohanellus kitauei]|uniref:Uncharacterized protein n=1 Tax=Thelohanellus kitauei TaxID=669202 RepID=A0A0C2MEG8_THEKT|nr:hypothetical protein RF11_10729 [Thelohanellus kitauei]
MENMDLLMSMISAVASFAVLDPKSEQFSIIPFWKSILKPVEWHFQSIGRLFYLGRQQDLYPSWINSTEDAEGPILGTYLKAALDVFLPRNSLEAEAVGDGIEIIRQRCRIMGSKQKFCCYLIDEILRNSFILYTPRKHTQSALIQQHDPSLEQTI